MAAGWLLKRVSAVPISRSPRWTSTRIVIPANLLPRRTTSEQDTTRRTSSSTPVTSDADGSTAKLKVSHACLYSLGTSCTAWDSSGTVWRTLSASSIGSYAPPDGR